MMSFMPWMSNHGLGLRLSSEFSTKNEKYLDSVLLNRLVCQSADAFDDSEFSDQAYIYATRFCKLPGYEDLLALANEDGKVLVQNTAISGSNSILTYFEAHHNAIFDVTWVPGNRSQLITVSGDQSAKLWNVKSSSEVEELRVFRGYTRSVKCVEFVPDDINIFATGTRENAIFIWDLRCPSDVKAVNVIRNAHTLQSTSASTPKPAKRRRESVVTSRAPASTCGSSITAIQFQDVHTLISSSDVDGIIKIWDLRKSYDRYSRHPQPKHQFLYPGKSALKGYSALILNHAKTQLYASCKDHTIYKFDVAANGEKPLAAYTGFENNFKYFNRLSISPDGRYLASGSSDKCACIWNIGPRSPLEPIARLEGHEAEVTCVEWCSKDFRLITCADDMKHRTWRLIKDKSALDKNQIVGEAVLNPDAKYFVPPIYKSTLSTIPSSISHNERKSVKSRIFEVDENDRNVENQFASIRISSSRPPPSRTSKNFAFPSCSNVRMLISPRKQGSTAVASVSPRKLSIAAFSPQKLVTFDSPTLNLPNLVLDALSHPSAALAGKSSSSPAVKKRHDWLTMLSRQKKQMTVDPPNGSIKLIGDPTPKRSGAKRKL